MEIRKEFFGNIRTDFMVGNEVEHTPAYGAKTLFVQGFKTFEEIYNKIIDNNIEHIYLGANRTFSINHDWNSLITDLLDTGFKVSLDYPIQYHNLIPLSDRVLNSLCFIPIITVDIANVKEYQPNLTLKIDDPTAINEGVWCFNTKELVEHGKFTAWAEYANDKKL